MVGFEKEFIPAGDYNRDKFVSEGELKRRNMKELLVGKVSGDDIDPDMAEIANKRIELHNEQQSSNQRPVHEISTASEKERQAQQEIPKVIFERITADIEKIRPIAAYYWLEKETDKKKEIGAAIRTAYVNIAHYIAHQIEHTKDLHMKSDLDLKLQELRGVLKNIPLTGEDESADKAVNE